MSAMPMKMRSATITRPIQAAGCCRKSAQPSTIQRQPRIAGTARPAGRKLRAASGASATGAFGAA